MTAKLRIFLSCAAMILSAITPSFAANYISVNTSGEELAASIAYLGTQIIGSNKHAFQVKLTKDERTYETSMGKVVSQYTLNRVWAKDNTIVCGVAKKNKKFEVEHIITSEPKFFFAGGLHVGDNLSVFTEFIGVPITEAAEICEGKDAGWGLNVSNSGGTVTWDSAANNANSLVIYFNSRNIITQIEYFSNSTYLPVSDSAQDFIISKIKELKVF